VLQKCILTIGGDHRPAARQYVVQYVLQKTGLTPEQGAPTLLHSLECVQRRTLDGTLQPYRAKGAPACAWQGRTWCRGQTRRRTETAHVLWGPARLAII